MSPPSDAARQWTQFYTENSDMMYPAEAVIRIFKGSYPKLKMPKPVAGQSILDVGCGDGRHISLFKSLGMKVSGTEITREILASVADRFEDIRFDLKVGTCADLHWPDATFDYLLAWNSCYYMGADANAEVVFTHHVEEMARVLKPGGWLVCSVPKADCFIFKDCEPMEDGRYVIIRDDHFGLRNGEEMRRFRSKDEIEHVFSGKPYHAHFTNFSHASIDIDMFGLAYNWHVFTAERR